MLFHHRPQLKAHFAVEWKETETIKKIVLTLEQVSFFITKQKKINIKIFIYKNSITLRLR